MAALRHTGFVQNFREDQRRRWGEFRRLQDHGAAGRERGRDLVAVIWFSGQFHGVIMPTTPMGSRTTTAGP